MVASMRVDREIVVWTVGPLREAVANTDLGSGVPVRLVADEEGFAALFPPHRNPLAYFVEDAAVRVMSAAVTALLASRALTFPPITLFGPDVEFMKLVTFSPNSRVECGARDLSALVKSVNYWTHVNVPLE